MTVTIACLRQLTFSTIVQVLKKWSTYLKKYLFQRIIKRQVNIRSGSKMPTNNLFSESVFYSSKDLQYFFISLFAMPIDFACLIASGQLFQILAVSMLKLFVPVLVLAVSFHLLMEVGLSCLSDWIWLVLTGSILKGQFMTLRDFHASKSFN